MQIPYDLEFVESRPAVGSRAIALPQSPAWASGRPRGERDAADAFLNWALRMLRRFEQRSGR